MPRVPDAGRMSRALTVDVAGEAVVLRGDRSLFWPRHGWLIVADLHLGKVQSLRRDGIALPDAVLDDDLQRLATAVRETAATRLLVLGDLVHDAHGLTPALVDRVARWRGALGVGVALVPGNHDRRVDALPPVWEIDELPEAIDVAPFHFRHEARESALFTWHGHLHPAAVLRGPVDRVRLPCFVIGDRTGILPAFSALTGGDSTASEGAVRRFVVADGQVLALPER